MAEQSREPEILKSIIDDTEYNKTPQSRNEEILLSILNDTEYTKTPQSREEELLLELKGKIGHGITVEPLSVTENGTYIAPTGKAYSPVEVAVPITPPTSESVILDNSEDFSLYGNIIKIIVPDGVKNVDAAYDGNAYRVNLKNLIEIELPQTLKNYKDSAFAQCEKLENIILNGGSPIVSFVQSITNVKRLVVKGGAPNEQYEFLRSNNGVMFVDNSVFDQFYSAYRDGETYKFGIWEINKVKTEEVIEWNFTGANPEYDTSGRYRLINNNVTFTNEGAVFQNIDSYLRLTEDIDPTYNPTVSYNIEIDVVRVTGGTRFAVQSFNFGSNNDPTNAIMYYSGKWSLYNSKGTSTPTEYTTISDLDGKKVSLNFNYSNVTIPCKKDVSVVIDGEQKAIGNKKDIPTPRNNVHAFSLGSHKNACQMVIKSMKLKLQW